MTFTLMAELNPYPATIEQVVWNHLYDLHGPMSIFKQSCHREAAELSVRVRNEWDRRESLYMEQIAMKVHARFN